MSAPAFDTERARNALYAINPDIERAEWWRVCAGAKAAGLDFADFDAWSQGGQSYHESAARDTWKSTEVNGGIGAGTLFDIAKQHGYQPGNNHAPARPTVTKATVAALNASRQAKHKGPDVAAFWSRCAPAESHPYIDAKDGTPDGLRIVPDNEPLTIAGHSVANWLVVPAYTVANSANSANSEEPQPDISNFSSPQSLQFIPAPGQGKKLNMPGASMKGASFTVGTLDDAGPVYVAEGIGQAWACHKGTGRPAVVAFGWGNVRRVAGSLPDNVVLVPDVGKEADAGRIAADIGASVAYMPEGEPDNFDANDYAQREGYEALAALLGQAVTFAKNSRNSANSSPVEPEPLRRPLPPAAPYPLESLGDVLGSAAQAIHEQVQAPAAMCGVSILAAASLSAQGQADVVIDGRREPLTLWAATIGVSGERKSGVDEWALGAPRQHEKEARGPYSDALLEYETESAAYEAARQKAKTAGKGNRDAIREALQDVGEPPEAPLSPILILGEPTLEGTQKQLIKGWPSIGLFSDDAGEFLGGYSMSKENRTRTAASLSRLWDKGSFDRVRAKSDEVSGKHYGKRCALHFMVQPVIAETVLSDDVLVGQGFLPRCLLAWPETTIGTREYEANNLRESPALRRYWAKIHALLDKPYPLTEGTRNELDLPALELSQDARALWIQVYNSIEHRQRENGEYAPIRAWASKAASQILRTAGVLTLIDDANAQTIQAPEVERAAELILWHLSEALRIVGTASVPREVKDAEKLRDWCHETGRKLLYSMDALQKGPNSIRTKGNFDAAVSALESAGWAYPVEGGAEIDGKHRRRVWQVVEGE